MTSYNRIVNLVHQTTAARFLNNFTDTLSQLVMKPKTTIPVVTVFILALSTALAYMRTEYELRNLTLF